MRVLLNGYTGRCTLNGLNTLMTSWGLSVSTNVIKSAASVPLWRDGQFKRLAGHAVRDYPSYQVSVSVEPEKTLFNNVMEKFAGRGFRDAFSVKFMDDATDIEYSFGSAYLTSFGLSVSSNAVCSLSFSFICFKNKFTMEMDGYDKKANKVSGDSNPNVKNLVGAVLMPYWAFGVSYGGYPSSALQEFSFDYSQPVEPKYGCVGSSSNKAVEPLAAVFGQPSLTYSLTYVMDGKFNVDDYDRNSNKIVVGDDVNDLEIKYNGDELLKFKDCFPDSYTPSVGQMNGVSTFGVSGTVYGGVEYKKID